MGRDGAAAQDGLIDHFADIAASYDSAERRWFAPEVLQPMVDLLVELAEGGPVLELGIGTGRVALPLHQRGLDVRGIDLSGPMVERLRAKPGGDEIPVTIGDFATTTAGGPFRLAYLVFNTINNLITQEDQVRCFETVAAQLESGGRFVVEVGVPDLQALPRGERFRPFEVTPEHLGFDELDLVTQAMVSHHYWRDGDGYRQVSIPFRYVWPSELDLMARVAGMSLVDRWAGWARSPFTSTSRSHVSVWQLSSDDER